MWHYPSPLAPPTRLYIKKVAIAFAARYNYYLIWHYASQWAPLNAYTLTRWLSRPHQASRA